MGAGSSSTKRSLQRPKVSAAEVPYKICLFGPSGAGKSTFLRLFQSKHCGGIIKSGLELSEEAKVVYQELISLAAETIMAFNRKEPYLTLLFDQQQLRTLGLTHPLCGPTDTRIAILRKLFTNDELYNCITLNKEDFPRAKEFFYFSSRFKETDYDIFAPTDEDFVRVLKPTTGIKSLTFDNVGNFENIKVNSSISFEFVDVGGAVSERKKWVHAMDSVSLIVCVVNLMEISKEPNDSQRVFPNLLDSHVIVESLLKSPLFKDHPIILLFTHKSEFFMDFKSNGSARRLVEALRPAKDPIEALVDYFETYPTAMSGHSVRMAHDKAFAATLTVDLLDEASVEPAFEAVIKACLAQPQPVQEFRHPTKPGTID